MAAASTRTFLPPKSTAAAERGQKREWVDHFFQPEPNPKRARLNIDLNVFPNQGSSSTTISDLIDQGRVDQSERTSLIDLTDDNDDKDKTCSTSNSKSNSRVLGVSLVDTFTAEEIQAHLRSLGDPSGKERDPGDGDNCPLCGKVQILYHVPTKDCDSCRLTIKTGSNFFVTAGFKYYFCASCFNRRKKAESVTTREGISFLKSELFVGFHDDPEHEGWVQCDHCQHWLHEVCGLYNKHLDPEGKMPYVCPHCRLLELQQVKGAVRRPPFRARDLPRTKLSNHIEKRLLISLEREQKERAESLGLSPDGVPRAEGIVVRVVSSIDKEITVKQQYLDILHGEIYPAEFPYKSKAILLFQSIHGVEVCIFAMYVQEFGSDCGQPNQRSVYISYLDSVRYFTPDVKTVSGEALRTFVYHEVLIGYLDHCKKRGYNKCYIWACPPSFGDDYILYCHPGNQKTPNPKKLLKWYKTMLNRAIDEKVVAEYSSFYENFLVQKGNTKITAARLPYFDGAYWTGAIEEMVGQPLKVKKPTKKRTFLSMGHNDVSPEVAEDIQIMQVLEQRMIPMKENFIVVRLQSPTDVVADTKENDVGLDTDIFQTRIALLDFCKNNHCQFDTLRRAKYSSMVILHHLHEKMVTTGNIHRQDGPPAEMKSILDVLSHASDCHTTRENPCAYPKCLEVKRLFRHGLDCKVRLSGGCGECKKLWLLIRLHARFCQESICSIPRCMDVKNTLA